MFPFFEEGLWCLDAATFPETVLRVESQQWDCYSGWETLPARSLGTSLATASLSTTSLEDTKPSPQGANPGLPFPSSPFKSWQM